MWKYYTRKFFGSNANDIEDWLNAMSRPDLPRSEADLEVVAYLLDSNDNTLITIRRWGK